MSLYKNTLSVLRSAKWSVERQFEKACSAVLGPSDCLALASFPRSGNTWLRALIENATGEETGTVYGPGADVLRRNRKGIVVKTHERDSHRFTRAIHLVRNPFDAVESLYHFYLRTNKDIEWDEHVQTWGAKWGANAQYWLNTDLPTYRIRYEDLYQDPEETLDHVLQWIDCEAPPEALHEAVESCQIDKMRKKAPEGGKHYFRRGGIGKSLEAYSKQQIEYICDVNAEVLDELGYEVHFGTDGINLKIRNGSSLSFTASESLSLQQEKGDA